ncbi:36991_t:CDS:2, partial [Gigaspora margarita]
HSVAQNKPFYLIYGKEATLLVELFTPSYPSKLIRTDQIKQKHGHDSYYQLHSFKIGNKLLLYKAKLDTHKSSKLEENGKKFIEKYYEQVIRGIPISVKRTTF